MKNITSLVLIASASALAACSNNTPTQPGPAPTPAQQQAANLGAGSHLGDVTPATLHPRPNLELPAGRVTLSQPLPPNGPVTGEETIPAYVATTDALAISASGATADLRMPVDSTQGAATLFLGPLSSDPAEINAALRDIKVLDPTGNLINLRAGKWNVAPTDAKPMTMVSLAGLPPGGYTFKLGANAAKTGVAFDVRQPGSSIVMRMKPSTYEHLLGSDTDVVELNLAEGTAPVAGAVIRATLLDPELKPVRPLTFKEQQPGHYAAQLDASALNGTDKIGAYLVDIHAEGTTATGAKFLRSGRTGFHFGIPTARIESATPMRTIKNGSGQIEAFEFDVTLESSARDRLELSATLAQKGADGKEHPVMIAFAGDAWDAGRHTVTLRFDAGNARLTRLEGVYELRNLKLFSLGTNTLFQRIGVVSSINTGPVKLSELAKLQQIPPGVQQLIDDGVLFKD